MAKHMDLAERRAIERALKNKKGVRTIARMRKRSPSSISKEIHHGSVQGVYKADRAQKKADYRRSQAKQQCLTVAMHPTLKAYVVEQITDDQSPEAVSGRRPEAWKNAKAGIPFIGVNVATISLLLESTPACVCQLLEYVDNFD